MPSWNIHIAQSERLLAGSGAVADLVHDRNAFLFGALVPDIYVGYMVPAISQPIPYRITHLAKPEPIPKPRELEFWDTYARPMLGPVCEAASGQEEAVVPAASLQLERETVNHSNYPARYEGVPFPASPAGAYDGFLDEASLARSVRDLTLGVWSHLVADNIWNTRVNEFLDARNDRPNEQFRIKKQTDFDWFGKTLKIDMFPRDTPRLRAAALRFPQYQIEETVVPLTVGVAHEIVRTNPGTMEHPPYLLLTERFFSSTFNEVVRTTDRLLGERLSL